MMTLLHVTDLHFNQAQFEWIAEQRHDYDLICLTGDLIDSDKEPSLEEQIEWIEQWFKKIKTTMFVCSGNHDIEVFDRENWLSEIDSNYIYPDNGVYTYKGIKIGCYPYIGAEGYFEYDECEILLHHVPPANTNTSLLESGADWGDENLYHALTNGIISPKYILSGHVHHPKGYSDSILNTTIYNPGYMAGNVPAYQIIKV